MPRHNKSSKHSSHQISKIHRAAACSRRVFLQQLGSAASWVVAASSIGACGSSIAIDKILNIPMRNSRFAAMGALQPPDENGVMLPKGFTSRIVARSNEPPLAASDFIWHWAPDGGAVFPTKGGGWIYVSNSEMSAGAGGVSALKFDAAGKLREAYPILRNTNRNCGGGMTPWGKWLSCEEVRDGRVWECDPSGVSAAKVHEAMGVFSHEAAAYDVVNNQVYLTEDERDGGFYRFTPQVSEEGGSVNLNQGVLEIARLEKPLNRNNVKSKIIWQRVPDPLAKSKQTRYQVAGSSAFDGLEGIDYFEGKVYFTEKGTNRVYQLDVQSQQISVIYDAVQSQNAILKGVDNLVVAPTGDIVVAEDGDDLQIVVITRDSGLVPIVQVTGHDNSELTGPAFTPDGKRLYFSSQRGTTGTSGGGVTFEISGNFYD